MRGIFGGFIRSFMLLVYLGRGTLGNHACRSVLVLVFTSMVVDGINSTLDELGMLHLYSPPTSSDCGAACYLALHLQHCCCGWAAWSSSCCGMMGC